jgi:hypothetical protein
VTAAGGEVPVRESTGPRGRIRAVTSAPAVRSFDAGITHRHARLRTAGLRLGPPARTGRHSQTTRRSGVGSDVARNGRLPRLVPFIRASRG